MFLKGLCWSIATIMRKDTMKSDQTDILFWNGQASIDTITQKEYIKSDFLWPPLCFEMDKLSLTDP